METAVTFQTSPFTLSGTFTIRSPSKIAGMSAGFKIAAPISTRALTASPFSTVRSRVLIPLRVSMVTTVFSSGTSAVS